MCSPVYRGGGVLNEADHLFLHIDRLGFEGKSHFVDQGFDTFTVPRAAQRLSLCCQQRSKNMSISDHSDLQEQAHDACDVLYDALSWVLFTSLATYISRAEAAVRSRCADNPVDI